MDEQVCQLEVGDEWMNIQRELIECMYKHARQLEVADEWMNTERAGWMYG